MKFIKYLKLQQEKYSYLVSYNYITSEQNGFGMINILCNKKLKYDDLEDTKTIIVDAINKHEGITIKTVPSNIIILNIVRLKR